jgi:hypothetical protein
MAQCTVTIIEVDSKNIDKMLRTIDPLKTIVFTDPELAKKAPSGKTPFIVVNAETFNAEAVAKLSAITDKVQFLNYMQKATQQLIDAAKKNALMNYPGNKRFSFTVVPTFPGLVIPKKPTPKEPVAPPMVAKPSAWSGMPIVPSPGAVDTGGRVTDKAPTRVPTPARRTDMTLKISNATITGDGTQKNPFFINARFPGKITKAWADIEFTKNSYRDNDGDGKVYFWKANVTFNPSHQTMNDIVDLLTNALAAKLRQYKVFKPDKPAINSAIRKFLSDADRQNNIWPEARTVTH